MLRLIAMIVVVLSAPVFLLTLGFGIKYLHQLYGLAGASIGSLGTIITFLGFASLLDSRQPPAPPPVIRQSGRRVPD
jgi:hypothetical protein